MTMGPDNKKCNRCSSAGPSLMDRPWHCRHYRRHHKRPRVGRGSRLLLGEPIHPITSSSVWNSVFGSALLLALRLSALRRGSLQQAEQSARHERGESRRNTWALVTCAVLADGPPFSLKVRCVVPDMPMPYGCLTHTSATSQRRACHPCHRRCLILCYST